MTVTVALSGSVDCPFNCNNKGTCTVNTAIANATKDSFTGELIGAFIDESAWEEEKVCCARHVETAAVVVRAVHVCSPACSCMAACALPPTLATMSGGLPHTWVLHVLTTVSLSPSNPPCVARSPALAC